jgi:hypothetical protein
LRDGSKARLKELERKRQGTFSNDEKAGKLKKSACAVKTGNIGIIFERLLMLIIYLSLLCFQTDTTAVKFDHFPGSFHLGREYFFRTDCRNVRKLKPGLSV